MKQRITVYFHDTAMVSFLREKPSVIVGPNNDVGNGAYHFAKGQLMDEKYLSIINACGEVSFMVKRHGNPSTIVVSNEDDGIIQMTALEFEERFKDKNKDQQIENFLADKMGLEDELADVYRQLDAIEEIAYNRGYEDAEKSFM